MVLVWCICAVWGLRLNVQTSTFDYEEDAGQIAGKGFLYNVRLPCRLCYKTEGDLPLTMFTVQHIPEKVWNEVLRKGCDLICFKCNRGKRSSEGLGDNYMTCDGCLKVKRRALFR